MPKKSSGTRKVGSAGRSPSHKRYVTSQRWNLNKAKRIVKHLRTHPKDMPTNLSPLVSEHVQKLLKKVDLDACKQKSWERFGRHQLERIQKGKRV
jgi:hypothetical protein